MSAGTLDFVLLICIILFSKASFFWFQTSEMTLALGDLFIHLFVEGFGSTEDNADDEQQQDAVGTGTGMGDGDGQKSVSSEIDDESQLGDSKVSLLYYILLTSF